MEASSPPRDYLNGAVAERLAMRVTAPTPGRTAASPAAESPGTVFGSCVCSEQVCPPASSGNPPDTHQLPCAPTTIRNC